MVAFRRAVWWWIGGKCVVAVVDINRGSQFDFNSYRTACANSLGDGSGSYMTNFFCFPVFFFSLDF